MLAHQPTATLQYYTARSCDEGGCSGRVVLEGRGNLLPCLVVAGKTVDTRLDENKAKLGVLVLAVGLQVLANGDGLLDEVPEVLRDLRGKTWNERGCSKPSIREACPPKYAPWVFKIRRILLPVTNRT